LTGYRLSNFVPGMDIKNLNKKVGCALIAAGLLAASSVQGSNAQDEDNVEEDHVMDVGQYDSASPLWKKGAYCMS
jgi:hypothetical protein